MITNTSTSD
jgi:hypothetical protein